MSQIAESPWNPLDHHRGPFRLHVVRDTPTRKMPWHSETLPGTVTREDVAEEAHALLTDPRDTITSVHVWSESEQQYVHGYRRPVVQDRRQRGDQHWTRKRLAAGLPAGNLLRRAQ